MFSLNYIVDKTLMNIPLLYTSETLHRSNSYLLISIDLLYIFISKLRHRTRLKLVVI